MKQLILVFIGGGIGSALRFWIGQYLNSPKYELPYGTFLVNIVGSLLIGLILGFTFKTQPLSNNFILFAAFDNLAYLKAGDLTSFAIYTTATLLIGLGAVFVGMWLVRFF